MILYTIMQGGKQPFSFSRKKMITFLTFYRQGNYIYNSDKMKFLVEHLLAPHFKSVHDKALKETMMSLVQL